MAPPWHTTSRGSPPGPRTGTRMKPVLTGPAVWLRTAKENRSGWNQKRPFRASTEAS